MRFPSRRPTRSEPGVATYAAVVADRVLWVATPAPASLVLVPVTGGPGLMPHSLDEAQPGHHGSCFELSRLPEATDHVLQVLDGRPVAAPEVRAVAPGTAYALTRDEHHHLHLVRRPVPQGPTLRSARLDGDRVELCLECCAAAELQVVDDGAAVVALPVDPEGRVTLRAEDLDGLVGERSLRLLVDGTPVRRRANDLPDPGSGALLPALHPAGQPGPRARLRWSPEAELVLRLIEPGR